MFIGRCPVTIVQRNTVDRNTRGSKIKCGRDGTPMTTWIERIGIIHQSWNRVYHTKRILSHSPLRTSPPLRNNPCRTWPRSGQFLTAGWSHSLHPYNNFPQKKNCHNTRWMISIPSFHQSVCARTDWPLLTRSDLFDYIICSGEQRLLGWRVRHEWRYFANLTRWMYNSVWPTKWKGDRTFEYLRVFYQRHCL